MKQVFSWNSIRLRLSTLLTLTVAAIGLVFAVLAYVLIRNDLADNLKFFALHEAQEVAIVISDFSSADDIRANKARFDKIFPEKHVMALQVWSEDGTLIFEVKDSVGPVPKWDVGLKKALAGALPYETFQINGRSASRAAQRVESPSGAVWVTVALIDRRPTVKAVREKQRYFIWGLAIAALVSFLLSWVVLTFALGHVQQMVEDARIIKVEGPGRRLAIPPAGSELSQLAQLLNEMLEKMEKSFQRLKRFTAHAGHELRTPLTRMRSEAELAILSGDPEKSAETMTSLLEEISELSKVIDALLELALEDNDLHDSDRLDFQELVSELFEEFSMLAQAQKRKLCADITSEQATVCGNRALLSRVLWNLFSNAVKYSPDETEISLNMSLAGSSVTLYFENECLMGPNPELESFFDPFFRGQQTEASEIRGYGLGLALTRSILKRHQGSIAAEMVNSKSIRFTMTLPLIRSATQS